MSVWHSGTGIVIYDPWRGDMKRRTTNWCVVNVDREITRYYREWLRFERHIHLQPPSWDAHISVVRGERVHPSKMDLWKKYHNKVVRFEYKHVGDFEASVSGLSHKQDDEGQYFFVEVRSPEIQQIREELGLRTTWNQHLTFGRIYDYEARKPKR